MELMCSTKEVLQVPIQVVCQVAVSPGFRFLLRNCLFPGTGVTRNAVAAITAVRLEYGCSLRVARDIVSSLTEAQLSDNQ